MKYNNEKQVLNIIKYTPPIFIVTLAICITIFLFLENKNTFESEKQELRKEYIQNNKIKIKNEVNIIYDFIQNEQKKTLDNLKSSLKQSLNNAYSITQNIYNQNSHKPKEEIIQLIKDALRTIRYNNGRVYLFIYTMDGINILHPLKPHLENKSLINYQDAKKTFLLKEMRRILKTKKETFYTWYWHKPNDSSKKEYEKIGFFKKFEPLGFFLGLGEYRDDFEKEVQQKILTHTSKVHFGQNRYIFILNYENTYLAHIRKEYLGHNAIDIAAVKDVKEIIPQIIDIAKMGEGYISYIQRKKLGVGGSVYKTSYVKGLQSWDWAIGTGFYEDDLNMIIHNKKVKLDEKFNLYIRNTLILSVLLTLGFLAISIYISRILEKKFLNYKDEIKMHLVENNQHKDILSQQSKMAAMGEMIGNIAHQWRQPLSVITIAATSIKMEKEMGSLTDDKLLNKVEGINKSAQYLSTTIDDFRNFFNPDKDFAPFNIKTAITKTLDLMKINIQSSNIEVIQNIDDIEYEGFENEFIQVLFNIINNAQDALKKLDEDSDKFIFIDVTKDSNQIIIKIKDNAKGIDKQILHRIFEPYFTTKHESQGTGIGLYMSIEIINKHMNGSLRVSNETYIYNDVEYTGAVFTITFET